MSSWAVMGQEKNVAWKQKGTDYRCLKNMGMSSRIVTSYCRLFQSIFPWPTKQTLHLC